MYDEENYISQKQTVIIDIHERKMAEEALKERENYLAKENLRLRENIRDRYKFGAIIGKSLGMQKVYELILRAAATSANVILYGESGTGKELVASAIHEMSDRAAKPFVPVNCAAIPAGLMESEFFGYRRGAFTGADKDKPGFFAQADRGTLFLDELGEIDEAMQVKLLRVLEGNGYTPAGRSAASPPPMSGSSPPPTKISGRCSTAAGCAKIFSTASTSSPSPSPRSGTAARTSRCWSNTS